jgi:hypothetical protein
MFTLVYLFDILKHVDITIIFLQKSSIPISADFHGKVSAVFINRGFRGPHGSRLSRQGEVPAEGRREGVYHGRQPFRKYSKV